jgi:uncharacterized membrane protein
MRVLARVLLAMSIVVAASAPLETRADEATSVIGTVVVSPLQIALELSASEAALGSNVRARATVSNLGPAPISQLSVTLRVDTAGLQVKGDPTQVISRLRPGQSGTVAWTVCGTQVGTYVLMASASSGGVTLDSDAHLLVVFQSRKSRC